MKFPSNTNGLKDTDPSMQGALMFFGKEVVQSSLAIPYSLTAVELAEVKAWSTAVMALLAEERTECTRILIAAMPEKVRLYVTRQLIDPAWLPQCLLNQNVLDGGEK
jgi:hypothetical protein